MNDREQDGKRVWDTLLDHARLRLQLIAACGARGAVWIENEAMHESLATRGLELVIRRDDRAFLTDRGLAAVEAGRGRSR